MRLKTTSALALGFLFLIAPSFGAVTTTNNGDGTTTLRAQYTVPTASAADVRDDICLGAGWSSTVTCTAAMVSAGQCTSGQLGAQVANPETCIQAIDRKVRTFLRDLRKAGEIQEAVTSAVDPVRNTDRNSDIQ